MAPGIRSELVAGRETDHWPAHTCADFECAYRRGKKLMCDGCKHGMHALCASEDCPCVCNDSDFRWSRQAAITETQREMAQIIAVRPELAALFR